MNLQFDQILVWLAVGLFAGSITGAVMTRRRGGFGVVMNLAVGLAGAAIGGLLFGLLGIDLGLGSVAVSFDDLVAAVCGAVVFLIMLRWVRRRGLR